MNVIVFLCIIGLVLIIFFGVLGYFNDKKRHEEILSRYKDYAISITELKSQISDYDASFDEYQVKFIENQKAYANVHDHLNKVMYQTALLKKGYRILRQAVIKKKVIQSPEQIKENIIRTQERKKLLNQVKEQLEGLDGKTNRKVS